MNHRTVAIAIFYDTQGRILLQERDRPKYGEEWGIFGGGMEAGETKEQALRREIKEELDYDIEEYEYIGSVETLITPELTSLRHTFIAPLGDLLERCIIHEGKSARLFTLEEAKRLKLVPGDELVFDLVERTLRKKVLR
jgi:8-oxo-dGTP pyrophosphatase MutT (NUDIX family)